MGDLVYINRGKLVGGSYSALLEYVDGGAADLPTVEVPAPEQDAPAEFLPDGSDTAQPTKEGAVSAESAVTPSPEPEPAPTNQIPWSTLGNSWSNVKYTGATVKRRVPKSAEDLKPTCWHSNWRRCVDFARKYCVPMVMVWSNGNCCGHCCTAAAAMSKSAFKTSFQPNYKVVWCYVESSDSDGAQSATPMHFARGEATKVGKTTYRSKDLSKDLPSGFPFTCIYWFANVGGGKKKIVVDYAATGFWEQSGSTGAAAAKKAVSKIKSLLNAKMKTYKYDSSTGQYKE